MVTLVVLTVVVVLVMAAIAWALRPSHARAAADDRDISIR